MTKTKPIATRNITRAFAYLMLGYEDARRTNMDMALNMDYASSLFPDAFEILPEELISVIGNWRPTDEVMKKKVARILGED